MFAVVGLGNPGPEYEKTRHNVGFRVADRLVKGMGGAKWEKTPLYRMATIRGEDPLLVVKPMTYMNRSGLAVGELLRRHPVPLERLLVVMDDTALPMGMLRLRPGGSAGGHRGLASVIQTLGTDRFPRLRLGIGSDPEVPMADYVLSPFSAEEEPQVEAMIDRAVVAINDWIVSGIEVAMTHHNR